MRTLIASLCRFEPLVVAHAREMFEVLSDSAIYEFENAPPANEEWLVNAHTPAIGRLHLFMNDQHGPP